METMRQTWTDERLDDLNAKVDRGFDRVETEMRAQRHEFKSELGELQAEMSARFDKVDTRFDRVEERIDTRFDLLTARIDALNRTLLGFAVAAFIALLASEVSPF
ncbi:MAG: hypothetical protein JJE35_12500 [Thermoleophilia bacterium]|nr:hypothetical protein [Thermoleophilia bacterium]